MGLVLGAVLVQPSRERRVEQGARDPDRHPVRLPDGPSRPPGVEQDAARPVAVHLRLQQLGVDVRPVGHERRAEAGAERRLGLLEPDLGSRELRREPLDEVVHHVLAVQDRHRRQDPEGVRGEQHDGRRVPPAGAFRDVRVARKGVGEAGVLGDGGVAEVEVLGVRIVERPARKRRHVLDDRPRHRQRGRDDRLRLLVEVDELRVAAVLEVREALVRPPGLVVPDEAAVRIGGEGGLPGPRKAEHDGRVVARADVARAVHGQVPGVRQQEVHHREDGLLDDPAVVGPPDDEADPVPEVEDDGAVRARSVALGLATVGLDVEHRPALRLRVDEAGHVARKHVAGEERVGGVLPDEAIGDRVGGIDPDTPVLHVQGRAGGVEMRRDPLQQGFEVVRIEGLEAVLPPDAALDLGPCHREGVPHRPPRAARVRVEYERPLHSQACRECLALGVPSAGPHAAAIVRDRLVEQLGRGEFVPVADRLEAERRLESVADIHGEIPYRFAGFSHGADPAHNRECAPIPPPLDRARRSSRRGRTAVPRGGPGNGVGKWGQSEFSGASGGPDERREPENSL